MNNLPPNQRRKNFKTERYFPFESDEMINNIERRKPVNFSQPDVYNDSNKLIPKPVLQFSQTLLNPKMLFVSAKNS